MSWNPDDPFADANLFAGSFPTFQTPPPFITLPSYLVFNEDGLIVPASEAYASTASTIPDVAVPAAPYEPPPVFREPPAEPGPPVTFGDLRMPGDYLPPSDYGPVFDPGPAIDFDPFIVIPGFNGPTFDFGIIDPVVVTPVEPVVYGPAVVSAAETEEPVSIWSQLGQSLLGGITSAIGQGLINQLDGSDGLPSLPGAGTGFTTGGYLEDGLGPASGLGRRRRRMDPCNSKALMRAARRLTMYANMNRRVDKALRKAVPARLRGHSTRKGKR